MRLRVFSRALMALTLLGVVATTGPARAQAPLGQADGFLAALEDGQGSVNLRYRLEYVDLEGVDKQAWASTLRTAIRYQTMQYWNLDLFLEAADVTSVGYDAYNSTGNGRIEYPVVADPELTFMNQAFLRYSNEYIAAKLGRQELVYDNERFVGNVGWRQNHQNFDSFRADIFATERIEIRYTYIDRVQTIIGTQADLVGNVVNLHADLGNFGSFSAYALILDFDRLSVLSTSTFGGFFKGKHSFNEGPWGIKWRAEYAVQQDMADNANTIDTNYLHLMGGFGLKKIGLAVGLEQLAGSSADGQFNTVFATAHKFNGWADKFLVTPTDGLRDSYISLGGAWDRFKYVVTWHDFQAESSSTTYGTEYDALVTYRSAWKQSFSLKAAYYLADDQAPTPGLATDVTKVWAFTSFNF